MLVRIEPNYVEPAKVVLWCRFWVYSSGQTDHADANVKEAQHVVDYKHRFVQTEVLHLSLLKFDRVEVLYNLGKLQEF